MSLSARQTSAYFAAFFVLGATIASLGPTLPYLAENTGATLASLGLLFTLRSGGYLIGSLLGGRLYDHLPGHRLLGIAIFIGALCLGLVPQISSFAVIIAIMLLIGLSEATLDVGSNTQLVWVHGARSGPYLNERHVPRCCFHLSAAQQATASWRSPAYRLRYGPFSPPLHHAGHTKNTVKVAHSPHSCFSPSAC